MRQAAQWRPKFRKGALVRVAYAPRDSGFWKDDVVSVDTVSGKERKGDRRPNRYLVTATHGDREVSGWLFEEDLEDVE
mgnify:CR=1 FL=1